MKTEKELEKQKLLEELIESSKSGEDKLIAARLVTNHDSQKVANAIKSLMKKSDQKTEILSSSFFSIVLGIGWLESLRNRSTQSEHR